MPTARSLQPMAVMFLVPNQAWVVVYHGNPIAIHDQTFWSDRADLVRALDALGLDVDARGAVERWCVIGRHVNGFNYEHQPLCPNHANQVSEFCDTHAIAHGVEVIA